MVMHVCMCTMFSYHVIMNRFVKQGVSDADMAEHLLKEWVLPRMEGCLCMHVDAFIQPILHCTTRMHVGSTCENSGATGHPQGCTDRP